MLFQAKKTFFQIANKNFIMLFVAYTVICTPTL